MFTCDVDDSGHAIELKLAGDAVMGTAVLLRERLVAAFVAGRDVIVDLDGLERLDGAGVQLLVALRKLVEKGGATMTVRAQADVPRAVLEAAAASSLFLS